MMTHTAIFYTNNKLNFKLLEKVLRCYLLMFQQKLPFKTTAVIISSEPLPEWSDGIRVFNLVAPKLIQNLGHLSIIKKISHTINLFPGEFISLHEHDVLYPSNYLQTVQSIISDLPASMFDYFAYNNLIGANKSGYLKRIINDYPLSTLTFKKDALVTLLSKKESEYFENSGWCYLEPGYQNSFGINLKKIQIGEGEYSPAVHVNMNNSKENHHISSHYKTYEKISNTGFDKWPGDLSYIFEI